MVNVDLLVKTIEFLILNVDRVSDPAGYARLRRLIDAWYLDDEGPKADLAKVSARAEAICREG